MLDTRTDVGGWSPVHGAGQTLDIGVAAGVGGVTGTLTLVGPVGPSYLAVAPCGTAPSRRGSTPAPATSSPTPSRWPVASGRFCLAARAAGHTLFDLTRWWCPGWQADPRGNTPPGGSAGSDSSASSGMQDRRHHLDALDDQAARVPPPRRRRRSPTPRHWAGAPRSATTSSTSRAAPSSRKPHGDTITTSARASPIVDHSTPSELAPGRPSTQRPPAASTMSGTQWPAVKAGSVHSSTSTAPGCRPTHGSCHVIEAASKIGDDQAGVVGGAGRLAGAHDRRQHLVERHRVERQHIGRAGQVRQRLVDLRHVDGAHRAQILGDDEIGVEVLEGTPVEPVQVFAGLHPLLDHGVDLRRCQPGWQRRFDTIRRVRASGGKSHSNVTPTTSSPRPSSNRISVADGNRETIRTRPAYARPVEPAALSGRPFAREVDGHEVARVWWLPRQRARRQVGVIADTISSASSAASLTRTGVAATQWSPSQCENTSSRR